MARRTSEEILAQREAWMSRKSAREAGEDVPLMPPLLPGETVPEPAAASTAPAAGSAAAPEVASAPEPVAAPTAPAAPPVETVGPSSPARKRTAEEILAQREAWMARKAAREAGQDVPPPPPEPAAAPKPAVATAAPATAKSAPAKKPAATPALAKAAKSTPKKDTISEPVPVDPNVSRREFLNYAWLASIALVSLETVGLSLWFAFPNFKAGQFGGVFNIGEAVGVLPEVNSGPVAFSDGKFWLINLDTEVNGEPHKGVMAIYKVCTHLGCLYEWVPMTGRFECPCHGSKFALTGDYIAGPARRSLDRFVVQALNPDGTVRVETDEISGGPLVVEDTDILAIDTGRRILGSSDITPA